MKKLNSPCRFRQSSPLKGIRNNKNSVVPISPEIISDFIDLTAEKKWEDSLVNLTEEFDDEMVSGVGTFNAVDSFQLEFSSPTANNINRGDGRGPQKEIGMD